MVEGGTSVNTIASSASLLLDLRSENAATLDGLAARVAGLARSFAGPQVEISLKIIGSRPAGKLPAIHPLVRLAVRALQAAGLPNPTLEAGSTDANVPLSQGLPSVCIGLTRGSKAHTTAEYIETEPLVRGLRALTLTVLGAFSLT